MEPKVSVIIPVYNAETTIWRTVESLIYAEEKNIEIILVDDCSKDKSWEQCLRLQDKFGNVRCIKNKQNKGVSYTRNQGIEEAKAPYIMFTDSDDWGAKNYISVMLSVALKHKKSLPVCGFHYMNQINYSKTDYVWNIEVKQDFIEIVGAELFDGVDKIMMQFCWNKIFKREVIEKNHIRFDESQSMGEDFEFVLDYMLAAKIHKCIMVNEPLYYYIRSNQNSLMSNFGWMSYENEWKRMEKLAKICGEGTEITKRLIFAKNQMRDNLIYHIVRTPNRSKKEKLNRIEEVMQDGRSRQYYREQKVLLIKERIAHIISHLKNSKFSEGRKR